MEIGTIQTALDDREYDAEPGTPSLSGRSSSKNGKGGGNDGGGGSGGDGGRSPSSDSDNVDRDKARVIAWFLLLVVLMTFGGLIGAYIVIATNGAIEWAPFNLPVQVWISTFIILASSITYEFFRRSVEAANLTESRRYLVTTTALGGVFIASQLIVWLQLVNRGVYMRGNPYAGFFYILTAAHALHVLGGMIALGYVLRRYWYPPTGRLERTYRNNVASAVGWYWHLMGGLWVVIFVLLGFWK